MAFLRRKKKDKTKPCTVCGGMGLVPDRQSPGNWKGCNACDGKGWHEVKE